MIWKEMIECQVSCRLNNIDRLAQPFYNCWVQVSYHNNGNYSDTWWFCCTEPVSITAQHVIASTNKHPFIHTIKTVENNYRQNVFLFHLQLAFFYWSGRSPVWRKAIAPWEDKPKI